ncbi:MAG: HPr family phosphocarrier protein, partial [Pseudomonadota bacterium]
PTCAGRRCTEFQASISVHHGERSADGKSILGMMTLAAGCGARLDLRIEGDDAERMVNCMARVLASDLDVLSIDTTPRSPCR